jgi:uncharacterized protein DUF6599
MNRFLKLSSSLFLFILAISAILSVPALHAQKQKVQNTPTVLPLRFGSWTSSGAAQAAAAPADAKDIFSESGLDASETRNYSNGGATVAVTGYLFHDTSGSYEAYSYLKGPRSTKAANAGAEAATAAQPELIGNVVLMVQASAPLKDADKSALSQAVKATADKTPYPPIPNFLPEKDIVAGTDLYALGAAALRSDLTDVGRGEYAGLASEAGFNSGAEAMLGRYKSNNDEAVLLLLEYPTPQLAGLHWKHLEQALPPSAKQDGTTIERKGSMLSLVLKPTSAAYADRLRQAVRYETHITWNEPTHTITDPPITSVLAKIIIATGAFMLVAIVFGVAFGGVRVALKRFFPGKVFDRPQQMDVLQLGLSGKRIDSKDFY